jgi:type I restriction enzyme, S subunit
MTLPVGWSEATLDDITFVRGSKADPAILGEFPFIGLEHIEPHKGELTGLGSARDVRSTVAEFKSGDILFGRLRPYLNKVIQATFDGCASAEIVAFVPEVGINAALVKRLLMSEKFLAFTAALDRGDRPRVAAHEVGRFELDLPPSAEQNRIVAKLDLLTACIARARKELGRVPILSARYRKDLLKAAFDGQLTAGWRERQKTSEPWRVVRWKEAGTTVNGRAYPSSDYCKQGIKLLRPGNLSSNGEVSWTDANTRFLPLEWAQRHPRHHITGKAIVINLTAQSLDDEFLGRACLSSDDDEFLLNQRIALYQPSCMNEKYCLYALKSPAFRAFVDGGLNSGSLIQHVHTKQLENFIFQVAPKAEQVEIVRSLDIAFAKADRLEAEANRARVLLDRLESAILGKAFRGELVPQDPNDEPASVLLERIRAQRASAPQARRGRRVKE